jgi:threonyl-tRNA synthetase
MLAILTEHYGGKWPLWLSPRQVMVVPINQKVEEYAQEVRPAEKVLGFRDLNA